jgi:hypothetical protein
LAFSERRTPPPGKYSSYASKEAEHLVDEAAYADKVVIVKGWEWKNADNYSYVRGSVNNTGDKTVRYFKVKALYKDKEKKVLDTAYTVSDETLAPGWSKKFEIMHEVIPECEYVAVYVEEIRLSR